MDNEGGEQDTVVQGFEEEAVGAAAAFVALSHAASSSRRMLLRDGGPLRPGAAPSQ